MAERKRGVRKTNPSRRDTKIAQLRIERGISQQELAEATGLSVRSIQDHERGDLIPNPRLRTLVAIAAALGVKLEDVCEEGWLKPRKIARQGMKVTTARVKAIKPKPGFYE